MCPHRELARLVGVLHLEPTHIVLHEHRDAAKIGVCADPRDLVVVELVDVHAVTIISKDYSVEGCSASTWGSVVGGADCRARCGTSLGSLLRGATQAKGRGGASAQLHGKPYVFSMSEAWSLAGMSLRTQKKSRHASLKPGNTPSGSHILVIAASCSRPTSKLSFTSGALARTFASSFSSYMCCTTFSLPGGE